MIDQQHIQISIPYELARAVVWKRKLVTKYETNQLIKAIDTWLVLKHETTSGYIQEWNQQKQRLLSICKCSEAIFRHRLKLLHSLDLVSFSRHAIRICSWETLGQVFEIDTRSRLTIQYNIYDKQRLQEWIIAAEIEENKARQTFSVITKLNKNPEVKAAVTAAMIAAGADRSKVDDVDYFLSWMRNLYYNDFIRVSDLHQVLIEFRPDNNRSVRGISDAWNCKHPVTVSYWKKQLRQKKIIDVVSLQIESEDRARNPYCKVLWLKQPKQTLLCLCDQIEILKPWLLVAAEILPAA